MTWRLSRPRSFIYTFAVHFACVYVELLNMSARFLDITYGFPISECVESLQFLSKEASRTVHC